MHDRSPAEHDESSTVSAGALRCRSCGYDLRGLDPNANCPECGTPVGRTLAGDELAHADPDWLRRLALGLRVDAAAMVILFLLVIPAVADRAYGEGDGSPSATVRAWLVYGFPLVLGSVGTWYLTTPEPGVRTESTGRTLRRALRVGVLLETTINFAWFGQLLPAQGVAGEVLTPLLLDAIAGPVLTVLWWVFLRRILMRAPFHGLALAGRFTMVGLLVVVAITQWLPWLLWTFNHRFDASATLARSTAAQLTTLVLTLLTIIVPALSARALSKLAAAHPTGQNPVGGSISHEAGSPDRG